MGKARGLRIDAKYSGESKPKADSHDITFEYIRAQKIVRKNKRYKTTILRRLRRIQRKMVAHQRKHLKLVLFGYWKYWFKEGKIGPEEDNEANLLHP